MKSIQCDRPPSFSFIEAPISTLSGTEIDRLSCLDHSGPSFLVALCFLGPAIFFVPSRTVFLAWSLNDCVGIQSDESILLVPGKSAHVVVVCRVPFHLMVLSRLRSGTTETFGTSLIFSLHPTTDKIPRQHNVAIIYGLFSYSLVNLPYSQLVG
jgi:hypothetical protein